MRALRYLLYVQPYKQSDGKIVTRFMRVVIWSSNMHSQTFRLFENLLFASERGKIVEFVYLLRGAFAIHDRATSCG
jgi:hypothetical protein